MQEESPPEFNHASQQSFENDFEFTAMNHDLSVDYLVCSFEQGEEIQSHSDPNFQKQDAEEQLSIPIPDPKIKNTELKIKVLINLLLNNCKSKTNLNTILTQIQSLNQLKGGNQSKQVYHETVKLKNLKTSIPLDDLKLITCHMIIKVLFGKEFQ